MDDEDTNNVKEVIDSSPLFDKRNSREKEYNFQK
jgi:hypothetical protein